jgi:drug/metabolite transporter (DMT)-like permease
MHLKRRPLIALLLMSLLWGYAWTGIKIGLQDCQPFTFVALRMSIAAICLLLVLPLTGRQVLPTRAPELIQLGLVQTTALMILSTWAVFTGEPGRVAFLVYTMPFFTLAMAWPLLGDRIRGIQWLACALAAGGLIIVVQPWSMQQGLLGNLLAVGAGLVWAISAIMVKQLQNRAPMDILSMTAWQMFFGCIPLLLLAWYIPEAATNWSPRFIFVLFAVSIVTSGFGWLLWLYVLNNMPAGIASMGTLAAPVVAMLTSAFHTGEQPSVIESGGIFLIASALLVLSLQALRERHTPASTVVHVESA